MILYYCISVLLLTLENAGKIEKMQKKLSSVQKSEIEKKPGVDQKK